MMQAIKTANKAAVQAMIDGNAKLSVKDGRASALALALHRMPDVVLSMLDGRADVDVNTVDADDVPVLITVGLRWGAAAMMPEPVLGMLHMQWLVSRPAALSAGNQNQ